MKNSIPDGPQSIMDHTLHCYLFSDPSTLDMAFIPTGYFGTPIMTTKDNDFVIQDVGK